jgi:hypothetical protein
MKTNRCVQTVFVAGSLMLLVGATDVRGQDVVPTRENVDVAERPYSPYAGRNFPTKSCGAIRTSTRQIRSMRGHSV